VLEDSQVSRVLVVTAHPDDVDFGAAGTVARWVDAGIAVTYCVITDGDAGGFDPAVPRSEIPGIRRAEQVAAAAAVGVTDVRFLGYRDGELTVTHGLRRDLSRVIREVRPDRMLIQSPERNWSRGGGPPPPPHAQAALRPSRKAARQKACASALNSTAAIR
jgi:LmbE family N-acetylglucosaminyl deacetylase